MSNKKKFFTITTIVLLLTIISKLLGFSREILIGYFIGTSKVTDAYNIALIIPNFFMLIIQQVISIAFIPIFLRLFNKEKSKAYDFTTKALLISGIISCIFSLLIFVLAKYLTVFFASGMAQDTVELTTNMLRLSAFSMILQSFVLIFTSFLQAKKHFVFPIVAGYTLDIVTIILFWFTSKSKNYYLLGLVPTITMFIELVFLFIISRKKGIKFVYKKPLFNDEIKELIKISIPALLSVGIYQLNLLVDKNIASRIVEGGIASLNYAQTIMNIFETLIMYSVVVIAYTEFCDYNARKEYDKSDITFSKNTSFIVSSMIPISIALFTFSKPIIEVIYKRGAFDDTSVFLTQSSLKGYSIGLVPLCLTFILIRYLYSRNNRYAPVIFSAISLAVNASLNYVSYRCTNLGISGVAYATSIANYVYFILLFVYVIKKYNIKITSCVNTKTVLVFAGSAISIMITYFVYLILNSKTNIYVNGTICAILYFLSVFGFVNLFDRNVFIHFTRKNRLDK